MPMFGPNIKKMKEKADTQGLINELKNKNSDIRVEAIKALCELKHIQGLSEALKNDDPKVCIESTRALADLKRTDELLEALKNKNPEVRATVIEALKGIGDAKIVDALIETITTDTVEAVQLKALEALSSFRTAGAEMWVSIGTKLLKRDSYQIALSCFEKAVQIKPGDKEMIDSIGIELEKYARYEDALVYTEKLIEIDPKNIGGWERKAVCLDKLGKEDESLSCCKMALEIEPHLLRARGILSAIYYKRGNYESLASFTRETLYFAPGNVTACVMLAETLMLSNKLSEAKVELEKTLEILHQKEWTEAEDSSRIHRELGVLNVMKGEKELALANFQKTFDLSRDEMDRQLQESYEILEVLGLELQGTPQDRRSRLICLVDLRGKGYETYGEKIIGTIPVSKLDQLGDGTGSDLESVKGMLKRWSSEHFIEFIRIRPRSEIEALIGNAETVLIGPNKERAR